MKVLEDTNSRLALRSDPIGQIIMGIIFFLAGLAISFFFSRSNEVVCQKTSPALATCTITEKLFGLVPVAQRTVDQVQGAEVNRSRGSKGGYTYQVVFLTPQQAVPMVGYKSSEYDSKAAVAEQVNAFIGNAGQNEVRFVQPMEWFTLLFLLIFGGAGIGMILAAQVVVIDADRSKMTLLIEKDGLFGVRQKEYPLREIEEVYVDSHRGSKGGRTYRVVFRMASGEDVPLTSYYSSGAKSKYEIAKRLTEFLNLHKDGIIQEENTLRFG